MFDGAEGAGPMNPFVKGLFSGKAIATQAHPEDEDTIIAAQQPVRPMRAPSTCRKDTVRRTPTLHENGTEEQDRDDDDLTATGPPCVAGDFRSALEMLFGLTDREAERGCVRGGDDACKDSHSCTPRTTTNPSELCLSGPTDTTSFTCRVQGPSDTSPFTSYVSLPLCFLTATDASLRNALSISHSHTSPSSRATRFDFTKLTSTALWPSIARI